MSDNNDNGQTITQETILTYLDRCLNLDSDLEQGRFVNHDLEGLRLEFEKNDKPGNDTEQVFKRSYMSITKYLSREMETQKKANADMLSKMKKLKPVIGQEVLEELDVDSLATDDVVDRNLSKIQPLHLELLKELKQGKFSYKSDFHVLMREKVEEGIGEFEAAIERRKQAEQFLAETVLPD